MLLEAGKERVGDEWITSIVECIPLSGRDVMQIPDDADMRQRGYSPWSRNFSASSAAMQPKPADVIACR